MANRISNPATQHFDKGTSSPLSGGQMFFFEIGSTTAKDTFSDEEETTANTNPVILDAAGVEPDIFGVGSYRIVLQDSSGVQQWERDPVNFEISGAQWDDWLATVDYGVNEIVQASDGFFYTSIQTPNLSNDPTTPSPTFWTQTDLLKRWNTNETYVTGDTVTDENSFYISRTDSNLGNQPLADDTNWTRSTQFRGAKIYGANNNTQVLDAVNTELDIFDTAEFDTDSMYDFATNPERLTVPAGVTKVKVQAKQLFTQGGATTGLVTFSLVKNGITAPVGPAPDAHIAGVDFDSLNVPVALDTGIVTVVAGDYYSIFGIDGTDGAPVAIFGTTAFVARSFLQMEIVE